MAKKSKNNMEKEKQDALNRLTVRQHERNAVSYCTRMQVLDERIAEIKDVKRQRAKAMRRSQKLYEQALSELTGVPIND